jgi:uncharacterized protein YacL
MSKPKYSFITWLIYFIIFELIVYFGLTYLLSGMGYNNQHQEENTIIPNWVKAIIFILLYFLCILIAIMLVSNFMPAKHRDQLMHWVYLALVGMFIMLITLFY